MQDELKVMAEMKAKQEISDKSTANGVHNEDSKITVKVS